MPRTAPEDMRETMDVWFSGASDEAIAFACELAAEISDDPAVPDNARREALQARLQEVSADAKARGLWHPAIELVLHTKFTSAARVAGDDIRVWDQAEALQVESGFSGEWRVRVYVHSTRQSGWQQLLSYTAEGARALAADLVDVADEVEGYVTTPTDSAGIWG